MQADSLKRIFDIPWAEPHIQRLVVLDQLFREMGERERRAALFYMSEFVNPGSALIAKEQGHDR